MDANWTQFCQAADLAVAHPHVDIKFGDDRRHRVTVQEEPGSYILTAFVVRQAVVSSLPNLPLDVWVRNRATTLVGFRIDNRGRLVAEAWVPKAGIRASEFQHYLRTLAIEADRFEYVLTGRDAE
jgi:hypothetical protein